MIDIDGYLKKWNLSSPVELAQTPTSQILKVSYGGVPAILKILTPIGLKCEAESSKILKCSAGRGTVNLLACDEGALLLEYADGKKLSEIVIEGRDSEADHIICYVRVIPVALRDSVRRNG